MAENACKGEDQAEKHFISGTRHISQTPIKPPKNQRQIKINLLSAIVKYCRDSGFRDTEPDNVCKFMYIEEVAAFLVPDIKGAPSVC